jgi:putative transposase
MTSLAQRQRIIGNIEQACRHGASLHSACRIAGVSLNCWYRWQQDSQVLPDRRPEMLRAAPANKLSVEEREAILAVCNSTRFSSLPPSQIVPMLADEGCYLASEASFYRILRQAYMDVSWDASFSNMKCQRRFAVLYAACLCRRFLLLALMAFAGKVPI